MSEVRGLGPILVTPINVATTRIYIEQRVNVIMESFVTLSGNCINTWNLSVQRKLSFLSHYTADTCHNDNVIITSKRRCAVVIIAS